MLGIHIEFIIESQKIVKQKNRKEHKDSNQFFSYHITSTQNHMASKTFYRSHISVQMFHVYKDDIKYRSALII